MKKSKFLSSTKYTIIICILLLVANIVFGLVFVMRSRSSVKEMVSNRMLGIANTAASLVDKDALLAIDSNTTNEDECYKKVYDVLDYFKKNIQFKYIYIVKATGDGDFIFVIDQDPIDPGKYGEAVVYTDALYNASRGTPSVDLDAYEDRWGRFYSAFSPIFDGSGIKTKDHIIGIVGVDFESSQYENDISRQSTGIILVSLFSLFIGGMIALLFSREMLKRFKILNNELVELSKDIDALNQEISEKQSEIKIDESSNDDFADTATGSVEDLTRKMNYMQYELRRYIEYAHTQAYVDSMTGVASKTAYLELVKDIEMKIQEGTADFKVIVFDVNGLKVMNDNYGHEYGDMLIINTAKVILSLYDKKRIFRIGGDEFIVIIEDETDKTLEENEFDINKAIEDFNLNLKEEDVKVSCSFGGAHYNPRIDQNYKQVFKRADEEMYRYKGLYYKQFGDRRKN